MKIFTRINFNFFITLLSISLLTSVTCSYGQAGCTDPYANNYNATATTNNGSCTYNTTTISPPVKVNPLNNTLAENSGLQWAGGSLWSFNDGGGAAAIYRIDTITNTIFQTVNLAGTANIDWEDIAFDGTNFYIGDFGNNLTGARTDLTIYKFPLSAIPDYASNPVVTLAADQIKTIRFTYADQTQPPVATLNFNTKFDCEAMIIDNGKIHLFTKNWIDNNTSHYVINSLNEGIYTAGNVETLATNYLVTGADKVEGKNIIALLGYQTSGLANHFVTLLYDYADYNYFSGNKRTINLPNGFTIGQAEGITFRNESYGYISNELVQYNAISITPKLRSFDINTFLPPTVLAVELLQFNAATINGKHKLTWNFVSAVDKAELQTSTNGAQFSTLESFKKTKANTMYVKPSGEINYYRLAWRNNGEQLQYSKLLRVINQNTSTLNHISIQKNGVINFMLNSNQQNIAFRLINAEGKTLAIIAAKSYTAGNNKATFSGLNLQEGINYLEAITNQQQFIFPVKVW